MAPIMVAIGAYNFDNSYLQYLGWVVQSVKKNNGMSIGEVGWRVEDPKVVESRCESFVATLCGKYKGKEISHEVLFHELSNGPKSPLACKIQQLQNKVQVQETRVRLSMEGTRMRIRYTVHVCEPFSMSNSRRMEVVGDGS